MSSEVDSTSSLLPIGHRQRESGYVPPPREQTWVNASFILVAELVGTGVLGLAHNFAVLQMGNGVMALLIFAVLTLYSGVLLHRLQSWFPDGITYGDIALEVAGKSGQRAVFVFIYVAFFGNLAIYILTCAEALQNVFYDHQDWCKWSFTVFTVLFLFPFCQLRTLHKVSYAASASAVSIFLALLLILFDTFSETHHEIALQPAIDRSFLKSMSSLTTTIFAFGGQGLYFETMAEMKRPQDFPRAISLTTILILIVYLAVAISCYSVYGDQVPGNILYGLKNGWVKRAASGLLFFHVCISYVLAQQVIGRAIHVRLNSKIVDTDSREEKFKWARITCFMLFVSFALANGVPIFKNLMGVIGAISTAPLTFGIPAMMVLSVAKGRSRNGSTFQTAVAYHEVPILYLFIVLTVFLMIVGLYSNMVEILNAETNSPFSCN